MAELVLRRRVPRKGLFYVWVGVQAVCYQSSGAAVTSMEYRYRSDAERSLRFVKTIWPKAKVVKG